MARLDESEAQLVRRMLRAFKAYGFFLVQLDLEKPGQFYQVLSKLGVSRYLSSSNVKGIVVISVNKNLCKIRCKEECSGSGDECVKDCFPKCVKELREKVVATLSEALRG